MKVRITDLPTGGTEFQAKLDHEALNKRMNEGRGNDISFSEPPQVSISLRPTPEGAELRAELSASYKQPCARCLQEVTQNVSIKPKTVIKNRPGRKGREEIPGEEIEDDVGIIYFEGESVDLEDFLQESLILSLTPYLHPACDKHGNCTTCGKNCAVAKNDDAEPIHNNPLQNLGTLLKQAKKAKG